MFIADKLLIETAQIALLSMAGQEPCVVSEVLGRPYQALSLAVFRGADGKRMAARSRTDGRFTFQGRTYRVIADISAQLDREDALLVEPA